MSEPHIIISLDVLDIRKECIRYKTQLEQTFRLPLTMYFTLYWTASPGGMHCEVRLIYDNEDEVEVEHAHYVLRHLPQHWD